MLGYIVRRILQAVVSLFFVALLVFVLSRLSGDPVALMLPPEATAAEQQVLREQLGLNHPLVWQFLRFLGALLRGDLGTSFRFNHPVVDMLVDRFPNSLLLATAAMAFATFVGIPVGIVAARYSGSVIDRLARSLAVAGQSIPTFVVGVVLVLVFAVELHWLPTSGSGSVAHLILPAITLGWFSTAAMTRMTRSSTIEALGSTYVTVARAKGLREGLILFRHALPNALTAILSLASLQFVILASGAVITEAIFNWPGIGLLMVEGAFSRDYALVQGVVVLAAFMTVMVNLVTDILYTMIDPRIQLTGQH